MNLYEELAGLVDVLNEARVDYALCGGLAVAFHGYPRFTKDIDLVVLAGDVDRVLDLVSRRGFSFRADPMVFGVGTPAEREVRRVSKIQGDQLLMLDLTLVNRALQPVWEDRGVSPGRDVK